MKKIIEVITEFFAYLAIKREAESGRPEPVIVPFDRDHTNFVILLIQWFIMAVGIQRFYGWVYVLRFLLPAFVFITSFFASESIRGFIWIASAILLPGAGDALMHITPRDGDSDYEDNDCDDESAPSEAPIELASKDGGSDDDEESDSSSSEDNRG